MDARIKSPHVARRIRGMGGKYYVVDAGKPTERIVYNARHFIPKGLDFSALCQAGRISVCMGSIANRSNKEQRRLVSREIERQAMRTANMLKETEHRAEANERYPTDAEWKAAQQRIKQRELDSFWNEEVVQTIEMTFVPTAIVSSDDDTIPDGEAITEDKTYPPFIAFDG